MSDIYWEWGYNRGVKIEGDHIVWYELPTAYASECACTQKFEHFFANGPRDHDAPPEIVEKLTAAVRERVKLLKPAKRKRRP